LLQVIADVRTTVNKPTGVLHMGDFSVHARGGAADVIQTEANGGVHTGAVYVRLFDPVTDTTQVNGQQTTALTSFTTSGHADHGTVGQGRWWKLSYLDGDILTLQMADPYRDAHFHATDTGAASVAGVSSATWAGLETAGNNTTQPIHQTTVFATEY